MQLPHKSKKGLSFCLAIFPAFFLALLVLNYGVNVPYWDQWGIAPLFEKIHDGSFSFNDLFMQHNESRLLFPKFVFIPLAYLTHWNVKYEMAFTFLLACIVSLNVYCLSKSTVNGSVVKRLLIAAIANLLIFAPIQWENWLWGIQMIVFVPIVCVTTCVLIAYSKLATRAKFLTSMCLSTISTFSYANGMLCWIVVFPVLVLKSQNELTKNRWLIFSWIIGFAANLLIYFYDYKKPPNHPSFLEAVVHPQQAIQYFLSFLGAPLSFGNGLAALIIGLVLMLLFLTSYLYLLKFLKDSALLHSMAGWLTIGMYTVISAIITTLGRVGFGVEQSLESRYTTFSTYLAVSLVYTTVIVADDIKSKHLFLRNKHVITRSISFLVGIFLILQLLTSIYAVQKMSGSKITRLQAKSCLLFVNFVQEECLSTSVYPDVVQLKDLANTLNDLGFLKPELVKSSNIEVMKGINEANSKEYGSFNNLINVNSNVYVASGWTVLPKRGEPADLVVLTYENVDGDPIVFTVVDMRGKSKDFAKSMQNEQYYNTSWQKKFSSSLLPKGFTKVEAWAFDSTLGKAFKINGSHKIENLPARFTINNIKDIDFKVAPNYIAGFFDVVNSRSGKNIVKVLKSTPFNASGWAILADEGRPADSIVITYGEKNSLVAVAPVSLERADVAKALNNPTYNNSGWNTTINTSILPVGKVVLKGWAYSLVNKEATQLNNLVEVMVIE